jgi:Tfp pilus assembly protein PilN
MAGLKEYIQTNLSIPTQLFDPFEDAGLYAKDAKPDEQIGHRLVTALGLLYDHTSVDLLPGEMKTGKAAAGDVRLVTIIGILWIALLVVIFIVLAGWSQAAATRVTRLKKELKATEDANREYFVLEKQVADLEAKQRSLTEVVGEEMVTVPLMAHLTRIVPDNIQLNSMALTGQRNVKLTGVVSSEPFLLDINLSQFMIDLEMSPHFQNVQLVNKGRNSMMGETVLDFEIQCGTE